MRYSLLYVFFVLIIQKEGRRTVADDGFKPMPIPLTEWNYDRRASRVGTLHEAVNTDSPPTVAAVPAHYWEDALRHSVYLTLVRDKIDQLIKKGTSDFKPDQYVTKETDDHDLWDKIKNAPFDRKRNDDYTAFGDVTIIAKGRLLEQNEGFRFTEDEKTNDKCEDETCMKGVKAFWSVKRVRQRDEETSPGNYHYELTFSVMSQPQKKLKKPYDNPVRTFTVREDPPDIIIGRPQQRQHFYELPQTFHSTVPRPQRAIWFHKNLVPSQSQARRYHHQGLDRIFSSLFGDDDAPPEPPRYRPNIYTKPTYTQHGKQGHVVSPSDQNQQKKLIPYPYKPPTYKYVRPPLAAPPVTHGQQHHYVEPEPIVGNSFASLTSDHRYVAPSNIIKTTRPAVLPTPPEPFLVTSTKSFSYNISNINNVTENTTREPEVNTVYKTYSKPKPTSMKVSYFPDHLRPPVYNAPPGVFVTMDKKPFKPMPPLKYIYSTKPMKNKPINFRPSPQLLDMQFSDPSDSLMDSEFRPILINVKESENETSASINSKKGDKHFRKPTVINKKQQKKHENIKSQRVTTSAPDIITAVHIDSEEETPEWTNVIGAFTKTTPMEPQKDVVQSTTNNENINDQDVSFSPSTPVSSTITKKKRVTSTTSTTTEEITTSTSPKPTRRTRPPPKFTKPDKIKKHKRVTTTQQAPLKSSERSPTEDLTPQASSAATSPNKPWEPKNKTESSDIPKSIPPTDLSMRHITSSTTEKTTTTSVTRSTTSVTARAMTTEPTIGTTQPKNKNRFRQSTLMHKGTSVNHDKWSINAEKNKTVLPPTGKFNPRRKGSNFQGHVTTSKPKTDIDHKGEDHSDKNKSKTNDTPISPTPTQMLFEDTADQYEGNSELPSADITYGQEKDHEDNEELESENMNSDRENESEDHKEYIFDLTSIAPSEQTNELSEPEPLVKEQTVTELKHSIPKNKTKCKKKKHHNLTISNELQKVKSAPINEPTTSTTTTTTAKASTDIFDDLLGGFTYDDTTEKTEGSQTPSMSELHEEESEKHEKYVQIDEDFEDFLDVLEKEKQHDADSQDVDQYEDDDSDKETSLNEDFSPFDNESEDESSRQVDDDTYEDYGDRSLSFLELMAME